MIREQTSGSPRVSVVVPTYKRPTDLRRCLDALSRQELTDFEVLCVCREDDHETRDCVLQHAVNDCRFKQIIVDQPGAAAAYRRGFAAATGEFVSFTDDDAEAPPHWLATIVKHLDSHNECGAVGGRDILQLPLRRLSHPEVVKYVGCYSWSGKFHATHHCPIDAEFVRSDVIKGVNMTYRRELIRDVRIGDGLRSATGTLMGFEQGICYLVHRSEHQIHFLRDAWIKHHCAPRKTNDNRRDMRSPHALETTFNNTYSLWRYQATRVALPCQVREFIIGSKKVPGLLRLLRYPAKAVVSLRHWQTMTRGIFEGYRDREK